MSKLVPEYSVYYLEIVTPDVNGVCDLYAKSGGIRLARFSMHYPSTTVQYAAQASVCNGLRELFQVAVAHHGVAFAGAYRLYVACLDNAFADTCGVFDTFSR